MSDLTDYGKIARKYIGRGRLFQVDDSNAECDFEIAQYTNADIILMCKFYEHVMKRPESGELKFEGLTTEGKHVHLEGQAINIQSESTLVNKISEMKRIFSFHGATRLQVGEYNLTQSLKIKFAVTNFIFIGTTVEESTQRLCLLPISVNDKVILIRQLPNYKDIVDSLKLRGVDVTSELTLTIENSDELQGILKSVDILCRLLTIARGTLINWIYFDIILPSDEIIFSQHEPRITARYSSALPLIDKMASEETDLFLDLCFENYRIINENYSLDQVLSAFVDARRADSFIVTRGLALVAIIEFLAGTFARINGNATFMDENFFNSKQKLLVERFKKLVNETFPDLPKEKRESLAAKWQGFNYPSFQTNLKNILKHFCVPFEKQELRNFVKTRNSLVHEAKFRSSDTQVYEFYSIMHLLDKLLLRMLGYEGYYINVTKFLAQSGRTRRYFDNLTPSC
jgi:hypothetical protein